MLDWLSKSSACWYCVLATSELCPHNSVLAIIQDRVFNDGMTIMTYHPHMFPQPSYRHYQYTPSQLILP